MKQLLMGNAAMALGALRAGVRFFAGYPGTPSSEVLETVAAQHLSDVYVEWSVNEKAALEIAAGAAYTGKRALVTMKQVGLNASCDPAMCLSYIGVKGGLVILVADDPGPISSQTEQDTRAFGAYSKIPVFDPSSPEEAFTMMQDAFELSEREGTPVILRPTTRVCHACAVIDVDDMREPEGHIEFTKDSKWVIFPRLSYAAHLRIEERNARLSDELSEYSFNTATHVSRRGIASGGVPCAYIRDALSALDASAALLTVGTPFPFPEVLAVEWLRGLDEVLVFEELDPVIERNLIHLCGKHNLSVAIHGKLDSTTPRAGELSVDIALNIVSRFLDVDYAEPAAAEALPLPSRPPVLCAGCPHRGSFYAVKRAMSGRSIVASGDIGCYTLGNSLPLDMVDTCLCMGAGITLAQGIWRAEPDRIPFAFVGDSTFFHSGITGVANAVYNNSKLIVCVLDNGTTAMTGHQPHPGTGFSATGEVARRISIPDILRAFGVEFIREVSAFDIAESIPVIREAAARDGVSAIIFKGACIALEKPSAPKTINDKCTACGACYKALGCPAIISRGGKVSIDEAVCTGCALCGRVCPSGGVQ